MKLNAYKITVDNADGTARVYGPFLAVREIALDVFHALVDGAPSTSTLTLAVAGSARVEGLALTVAPRAYRPITTRGALGSV